MHFARLSALSAALIGSVVARQEMPDCAANCLQSSLQAQSVCLPTNLSCVCEDAALKNAMQACVGQVCKVKEIMVALNVTATMCGRPLRDQTWIPTVVASVTGSTAVAAAALRTGHALFKHTFGHDDACAAAASFFVILMNGMQMPIGKAGFGRDVWTVSFDNIVFIQKMIWLTQVFYWPISALTKLAFLFFYLRIFPRRGLRKYVYITMGLTCLYWLTFQLGKVLYCQPISLIWDGWDGEHEGHCAKINTFMVSACAVNIVIDFIIILIPIPELWRLNMSWRKKGGVLAIFLVGVFTLIVSCLRVERLVAYATTQNPTWDNIAADYWSIMEANLGVFCVCMPALRRLLSSICPAIFASTHNNSAPYDNNLSPTTPARSSRKRKGHKFTIGGSLSTDTGITKTVDATVTYGSKHGSDDEIELVSQQFHPNLRGDERSMQSVGSIQHESSQV